MAPRAGCARGAAPGRRTGVGLCGRSPGRRPNRLAQLLAGVLLALRFLALPLHARLLVMLASASLGEDAGLLDLLVEAAEGAFERLVLTHTDFCQSRFTSSGSILRGWRCARSHRRRPTWCQLAPRTPEHSRGVGRGQPTAAALDAGDASARSASIASIPYPQRPRETR